MRLAAVWAFGIPLALSGIAIACATVTGLDKLQSGVCGKDCGEGGEMRPDTSEDQSMTQVDALPPEDVGMPEASVPDGTGPETGETDSNEAGAGDSSDASDARDSSVDATTDGASNADAAPPPLVARLNIEGDTDYNGVDFPGLWRAAPVPTPCGPYAFKSGRAIHGTRDGPLFSKEASGTPLICTIGSALPAGMYRVRMYFAEIYWGPGCEVAGGVGSRIFDIQLQGKTVLQNFDVFAESGGCMASSTNDSGAPVVKTFDVAVTTGVLDITMQPTRDRAKISALEVFGPL